jgi:hypothetical protein
MPVPQEMFQRQKNVNSSTNRPNCSLNIKPKRLEVLIKQRRWKPDAINVFCWHGVGLKHHAFFVLNDIADRKVPDFQQLNENRGFLMSFGRITEYSGEALNL